MTQYEMHRAGTYSYTLGDEEDPREALNQEQHNGGRRLSITKVEGGVRTPNFLTGQEPVKVDREEQEEDEDFEEYA